MQVQHNKCLPFDYVHAEKTY